MLTLTFIMLMLVSTSIIIIYHPLSIIIISSFLMLILILSSIMLFSHFQSPLAFRADFGLLSLSGQFLHWIFPMEYWKQSHKELFVNYFQSFEPKSGRKPSNMECFAHKYCKCIESGKTKTKYEKCWAFQRKVWHIVLSIVAGRQWDKRAGANSTRWWMLRLWWGFWPWGRGKWGWRGCAWNNFWWGSFAGNRCCDFVLIMYRIIQRSDSKSEIWNIGILGPAKINFCIWLFKLLC